MSTRILFRTGSCLKADDAARLARGHETLWFDAPELVGVEPAKPGDCWRVRWAVPGGGDDGPIAGYAICCPLCLQVHSWTGARNCPKDANGTCVHNGVSSCWTWTGSPEDGTLSASPSLYAINEQGAKNDDGHGCGWHGFLHNGELTP